jgi:C-terminal processing protease CtpA/Prc
LLGPAPDLDPPAVSSSSSEFGIDMLDSSLFSAETSFEEQFSEMEDRIEVMAPAGKLGMVIDTPAGGVPIVHAIKESSVLAKQVQVGDRLVSVDDEDTTGMTAMQVSKLISLRADSDSRTLVFVRNKPRRVKQDP